MACIAAFFALERSVSPVLADSSPQKSMPRYRPSPSVNFQFSADSPYHAVFPTPPNTPAPQASAEPTPSPTPTGPYYAPDGEGDGVYR